MPADHINQRRRNLFILVFLGLFIPLLSGAQDTSAETSRQEIASKMNLLTNALLQRDSLNLDRLLDSEVTYGHSNGLHQTKAEVIRSIMSRQHDYQKIDTRSMQIRMYQNTAVVNTQVAVSMLLESKALELQLDIQFVWIQENGNWKLVARQSVRSN
ncbi:MAG: nuclear transport factor 2 family protein [Bacteroidota bacterium]